MQSINFEKILANLALLIVPATVGKALVITQPKDNCCRLWQDANFSGGYRDICYDVTYYGKDGEMDEWYGAAASYWCGNNVSYSFCGGDDWSDCSGLKGTSAAGNIRNRSFDPWSFSKSLLSFDRIQLRHYDARERGAVTLFDEPDCAGRSGAFFATQEPTHKALYNTGNLVREHLEGDMVSSVLVPRGYTLRLYEHDGFTGNKVEIDGSEQDMECVNLNDEKYKFDDMVGSLSIFRTNKGQHARGYWKSITATEGIEYVYHVGMSSALGTETGVAASASMTADMEAGVEFGGFGNGGTASVGLSTTVAGEVSHDATQAMTHDMSINISIKCTGEEGVSGGVGLWQFVVETGDASIWTQTNHTVCRYGNLYNKAPECPWNACIGGDCSACEENWAQ